MFAAFSINSTSATSSKYEVSSSIGEYRSIMVTVYVYPSCLTLSEPVPIHRAQSCCHCSDFGTSLEWQEQWIRSTRWSIEHLIHSLKHCHAI